MTLKEQRFVDAYVDAAAGNATRAAEMAGYKSDNRGALAVTAHEVLHRDRVQAAIASRATGSSFRIPEIQSRKQVVYFIQAVCGGPVKIGITTDVRSRLKAIQACCPFQLRVLGLLHGASTAIESELHDRFSRHRLHGEWFAYTDEISEFVASLIPDRGEVSAA